MSDVPTIEMYNRVQIEKLTKEQREIILDGHKESNYIKYSYTVDKPESWSCNYKYMCTVLLWDDKGFDGWIKFGFTNRNRLRNRIQHLQSCHKNIVAKVIARMVYNG